MKVEITKISKEMYIVNGKSLLLENGHWRPQVVELTSKEATSFKQRLNAELFNEKNKNYATIGNIRYRRFNK